MNVIAFFDPIMTVSSLFNETGCFFLSEAKFTYDLSPIAVSYSLKTRHWYDYFTSVMAIIGGTFTVVGMIESGLYTISSKKRR